MCSIAFGRNVEPMLKMMKHRAPDGYNIDRHDGWEIGMGRLAIIDLQNQRFPFVEGDYTLTFNGEIYNYIELREELLMCGHQFETDGDTEVLLKAFIEWGSDCLDKLNGMFAFAIWDKKHEMVFFARDIAGEKPLYFRRENFAIASEAKALDWQCEELPPACFGSYDMTSRRIVIEKWWKFTPRVRHFENPEEELEKLLEDSIRLRTRSDVPYGLYLSKGVDSTLISTFHPFAETFSYTDGDFGKEFKKIFEKICWHLDYPNKHFSSFGLWQLAEQAKKKGVKVVLSGEGADELFGGYIRYVPNALNIKAQKEFPSYKTMFPVKPDEGWVDFNSNLQQLLRMGDRMASAHGIENRCPFLDRRIIEFAFSLPLELRAYGFDTKVILNRILRKRMPDYQPIEKAGLYCSVNAWFGESDPLDKTRYLEEQQKIWQKFQSS